ncbi:MAG: hypothetical protein D6753_01735 [Planctomycetota bacterium]|nr:MAG: hypothetical protein D6753_01735 [Planctomycetota bacterium]
MAIRAAKVGDKVVFSKDKHSPSPGPRARDIAASPKGDDYSYIVEKYWVVAEVNPDGTLLLKTRRGKEHRIPKNDPRLRHATLWERLRYRNRFPSLDQR